MASVSLRIDFRLDAEAPLALPSRSGDGQPSIPASMLKGAARRRAAEVAVVLGLPRCRADGDPSCAVCRLFGAPGLEASLRWLDAAQAAVDDGGASVATWRTRRQVSRALGTGDMLPERLQAALPSEISFSGRVEGRLRQDGGADPERDAALVIAALRLLDAVGGGRSVGCGSVQVQIMSARLGGTARDIEELLGQVLRGGGA